MELEFIMDGGADALNGTIWFPNTPSPPYEQLSPVRQNRRDPIATQHVSFLVSVLLPQIIEYRLALETATLHDASNAFPLTSQTEESLLAHCRRVVQRYQPISLLCSLALLCTLVGRGAPAFVDSFAQRAFRKSHLAVTYRGGPL